MPSAFPSPSPAAEGVSIWKLLVLAFVRVGVQRDSASSVLVPSDTVHLRPVDAAQLRSVALRDDIIVAVLRLAEGGAAVGEERKQDGGAAGVATRRLAAAAALE